ncbi:BREX system P-loop protein BrxC [Alkalimarinus alittae]|uniref:BREX system P-loop protein BrxC n=1 Tax=Alkalimarinus alittae TaxID=2961619 RepID=A0ABY6MX90_9ALTE|nr:BREX system P-loop protein BrxC [Alkalimarinus alittae]UZE94434.1 BREX system P-loop protein BrxC [Alkalimarinus alittae]
MQLEQLFTKPVDRAIEGVIKADDDVSLYIELDEYVITNEVAKRLDGFLDAYLNYAGANGVWVSGFFGSGKSHLLKMLALLLQNKPIEGEYFPLDLFLSKHPFNEGGMQAEDLKRAVAIPSESILFNIDQKADVISKDELDALVAVFVKVFDEHCGYYGKHPYIAQFERELDVDGQFDAFKTAFAEQAGRDWESGRQRAKRMAQYIDQAYSKVTGTTVSNILDKYRDDYRLSIEDFAEQVNDYVESKDDTFRLNFFVDEVGQYIADNIKLMTNLQTVAESLATKCKGRSWVVVTAQEDMSAVLGDGAQQSNDFSKIQARFKNRMKLNSQDVAEVIQRRLLAKRQEYINDLSDLFHKQENNFKTLFDFADGSASYPNFKDREHFIQSYPFIPYQFTLFQSAIQNLSRHSAFEGKNSSVGERSMLGVFQQVAIGIKGHQLGDLATFDLMFEGIRTALKGAIQSSILRAENTLTNDFALRVLKALFLVKYVKEFKPTVRNICVLMQTNFETSITALKADVEEALALLENQTLIQRNGELYEYLTDEEQDVEAEIKNTDIDTQAVAAELEKLVFDGVIKNRKIRWDESGQDYAFTRKLDENQIGREHELAIHVITSFLDYRDAFEKHKTDTVYNDELRVVMPDNDRLIRDLMLYKQTEKYISHETRTTQQDTVKRILAEKAAQNGERYNQLKTLISSLMGKAVYFVGGKEIELAGEDGQTKVFRAFIELAKQTYPNHKMLRGKQYQESEIAGILAKGEQGLFGDETILPEAQQEMFSHIQSNHRGGIRTTVKLLLEKFERKPYGWSYAAVLCTLAHLCARGKIEVRESTNLLDDSELARALINSNVQGNLILDPQVEFTPGQTKKLKAFFNDYFDKVAHATEAKALAKETQEAFSNQKRELERLHMQAERYPFLRALTVVIDELAGLDAKPYPWFVTELVRDEDKWLDDYKDRVIDPIVSFMKGSNKTQLDDASGLLNDHKANLSYVQTEELEAINATLVDPAIYKGNAIQVLISNMKTLKSKLETAIGDEKTAAIGKIESLESKLTQYNGYTELNDAHKAAVQATFDTAKKKVNDESLIAMIRDTANNFENTQYIELLQQIEDWSAPKPQEEEPKPTSGRGAGSGEGTGIGAGTGGTTEPDPVPYVAPKPQVKIVGARDLTVSFSKPLLETEADVDAYLESYKQALMDTVKQGKKVRV